MKIEEKLFDTIKNMSDDDVVALWNEYCRNSNNYDDEILSDYELEELIENSNKGGLYWINRFFYGHDEYNENGSANPNRKYFYFNGYGNIISFDYVTNQYAESYFQGPIDIDNLIDYIIENDDALYNDDVQEVLDAMQVEE